MSSTNGSLDNVSEHGSDVSDVSQTSGVSDQAPPISDASVMSLAVASSKPELWTSSSNEAMDIYITNTDGTAQMFKPAFTYPIFGDAETIFGYQDLQILVCFDSVTFLPFLNVKYTSVLPQIDVDAKLKMLEYLPESTTYKDEATWRDRIDAEQKGFKIPGDLVQEWTSEGETYGIYQISLSSENGTELLRRLQILVLLFIEAGSYIEAQDPLWDFFVLYRTSNPALPEIVGFTTVYNYWVYPGHERFDAGTTLVRKKISQFVILPIHQGKHFGSQLYRRLYEHWVQDDKILEVVVEDPNEAFDDMRDRTDFQRLTELKVFSGLSTKDVTPDFFASVKTAHKLEKRQLHRLFEMAFLDAAKRGHARDSKKDIRLFIKKRLYEKNREALEGMDEPTRLDKLQTAYQTLEEDYYRILEPLGLLKRPGNEGEGKKRVKTA